MPVQVSYPGVYIQEVPSGVHTITGVSTSIAAFFGRTQKGPIDRAVRCLSFSDFLREFGGPHPLSDLAQSVKQFFDNGGTDCYVVRLAKGADAATLTLKNLAGLDVLKFTAKASGAWAHDVKVEVDYNTATPDDTFNLSVIHEVAGNIIATERFTSLSMNPLSPRFAPTFVTQSSKLVDLALAQNLINPATRATDPAATINLAATTSDGFSQSRRLFAGADIAGLLANIQNEIDALIGPGVAVADRKGKFSISVNGSPFIPIDLGGLNVKAGALDTREKVLNEIAKTINDQIHLTDPSLTVVGAWDMVVADQLGAFRLTSATGDKTSVRVQRAPANDFAALMLLGVEQGGIEVARYSNLRPAFNGTAFFGTTTYPAGFITNVGAFANLAQNAVTGVTINDGPSPTPVTVNLGTSGAPGARMYNAATGLDGVREKLRIIAERVNADPNVPWTAELWGYHLAFRRRSGGINEKATVTTAPNATVGAAFIANTRQYVLGNASTSTFAAGTIGDDGDPPDAATYGGDPQKHTGFYALDKVDLFNLMVLPGDRDVNEALYTQIVGPASIYCQQHRAFLILDAPDSWTDVDLPKADASAVNNFRALVVKDYSGAFYPKVVYADAGLKKLIGPGGMIAGLMARTDTQRGVWKAPAGTEADLRGVLDLEVNLTDLENGVLNKLGVNCIRKFPVGIVNWGARTLAGSDDLGSEWKYIPIRRLALFLEESLFRGTKWVVFEPNDEPLWAQIRLNINAFMMGLFRQGAFQGTTPDKAFYVKCDSETTTQNDRNLGIVNIEVGFAPLKPAEFVVIKIQQIAGDLT